MLLLAATIALQSPSALASVQRIIPAPATVKLPYRVWPSVAPEGCPFPSSALIAGLGFTGKHAEYADADTWYPSWASDGAMYSTFTDGRVNGLESVSFGQHARTGYAKVVGDDPMHLQIVDAGMNEAAPTPYGGRYPCGSLMVNGVWYCGTYCLMNEGGSNEPLVTLPSGEYNWSVLGPFVGFRHSTDGGKTWIQTKHTPSHPLFPEPTVRGGPVRIGSPHFLDFGQNMEHSPDGKAYLVAHGAAVPDPKPRHGNASWITGDCIYLLRVTPTPEDMDDGSKYEFFAGRDKQGKPIWTHDFAKIEPIADWNNRCGCVTMTYDAPLKRYLMCITDGRTTISAFNTFILESASITGPWRLATYMTHFGTQGYFVNLPSKFIGANGRDLWLCYSANFMGLQADPPGSRYGMCLQQIRLLSNTDPKPNPALNRPDNVARIATVTVSSTYQGYDARGAVDGLVGGFPVDNSQEWASNGEEDTAFIRLNWDDAQAVDRVWLFDRPNPLDQIRSGMLVFSDGSTVATGTLPDDAKHGLEVRFKSKRVRWVAFIVTGVKPASPNIGLAEIAVFRANR